MFMADLKCDDNNYLFCTLSASLIDKFVGDVLTPLWANASRIDWSDSTGIQSGSSGRYAKSNWVFM